MNVISILRLLARACLSSISTMAIMGSRVRVRASGEGVPPCREDAKMLAAGASATKLAGATRRGRIMACMLWKVGRVKTGGGRRINIVPTLRGGSHEARGDAASTSDSRVIPVASAQDIQKPEPLVSIFSVRPDCGDSSRRDACAICRAVRGRWVSEGCRESMRKSRWGLHFSFDDMDGTLNSILVD